MTDAIAPEHLTRKEKNKIYQKRYRSSEKGKANHRRYVTSEKGKENLRKNSIKHRLKRKYGLSLDDYKSMLDAQSGVCAICKQPETMKQQGVLKPLAVDHNHKTGTVRQLLCNRCNRVLGFVDDKEDILKACAVYLREWDGC